VSKPRFVAQAATEKITIKFYVHAPTMRKAVDQAKETAKEILRLKSTAELEDLRVEEREAPEEDDPKQVQVKGTSPKELAAPASTAKA